jgi:NADPH:quinone reductase
MGRMHAIRMHSFGGPSVLTLEELPDLTPAEGEVRIAVEASGVHLLDTSLRRGEVGPPLPLPELPTVPGREVAGVVDAVGRGVSEDRVGRRVVAHLGPVPGGYAGQAVVAESATFEVPSHVGFPEAVAAVGTGRTALAVATLEPAGPDDVVLVPSAAGGLGWLLVQSALAVGARVVAAAGGARTEALAPLGADLVVDYRDPGWAARVRDEVGTVSLVWDGVGGEVGQEALSLLGPGGRLVMFGWSGGTPTQVTTDDLVRLGISASWSLGARIAALPGGVPGLAAGALARVASGEWRPLVSTYPLAEAARAHADLEGRAALGKVVLVHSPR